LGLRLALHGYPGVPGAQQFGLTGHGFRGALRRTIKKKPQRDRFRLAAGLNFYEGTRTPGQDIPYLGTGISQKKDPSFSRWFFIRVPHAVRNMRVEWSHTHHVNRCPLDVNKGTTGRRTVSFPPKEFWQLRGRRKNIGNFSKRGENTNVRVRRRVGTFDGVVKEVIKEPTEDYFFILLKRWRKAAGVPITKLRSGWTKQFAARQRHHRLRCDAPGAEARFSRATSTNRGQTPRDVSLGPLVEAFEEPQQSAPLGPTTDNTVMLYCFHYDPDDGQIRPQW